MRFSCLNGEVNQWLRSFVVLTVDLDLIPSSEPSVTRDPGEPMPFLLSPATVTSQDESLFQYFINLFFLPFVNFLLISCFHFWIVIFIYEIYFYYSSRFSHIHALCVNHTCAPLTLPSSTAPFQLDVTVFIANECCHILMGVGPSNPL